MKTTCIYIALTMLCFCGCREQRQEARVVTPWGEVKNDSLPATDDFTLSDIVTNGELIMLTMTGPDTYYDYHGRGMGTQFLLCERFAQSIGVSLRVELCKDSAEMVARLERGEGDVIAYALPDTVKGVRFCGGTEDVGGNRGKSGDVENTSSAETNLAPPTSPVPSTSPGTPRHPSTSPDTTSTSPALNWAVLPSNRELAEAVDAWYRPEMVEEVKREERFLLSAASVKRHVYSPFLNRGAGIISKYDDLFRKHAATARWDWRLMAAQCYQESCFDPKARSWAGARGLMQIMPGTAAHLGLPMEQIHEPEPNIAAAARYIAELTNAFRDIPNTTERQYFVLAAYNGGSFHVRDAMALTEKGGGNPRRWADVARHMLLLRDPAYYNDPVVKHGYMRAGETVDYVEKIRQRYAQYRGVPAGKSSAGGAPYSPVSPRKAKKKHRFHV